MYLRSFKETIHYLNENLLKENNIDIYIHITKSKHDKYNNKELSIEEIYNLLNPKILLVSDNIYFNDNQKINDIINQNYKLFLLNEQRKYIEKTNNIKYTNIIKLRPDIILYDKINLNTEFKKICIPYDSKIDKSKLLIPNDHFVCDIIAYGNVEQMDKYFHFYIEINSLINKYGHVNETLLYHYLDKNIEYELVLLNYIVLLSLCNTIAISGDSGSGKTSTANLLKDFFTNSFVLECDRYHKWERGHDKWNYLTHLNPESNYLTKMENDVFDLKIGKNIYQVDYNHSTGKFTDKQLIENKENLIVCGLHSLYIKDNILNIKIYMDTDENLRIVWKIKRDINKRGYTVEKILSQINSRKEDFKKYIYPQREKSDIIINFYTNKIFNENDFNLQDNLPEVFLRIGIKNIFKIEDIICKLGIYDIEKENDFFFFNFKSNFNFENIIKTIILNI